MCNCYGLAFGLEVELVTDDKSFPPRSHHFPNFSPTFLINSIQNVRLETEGFICFMKS